MLSNVNNASIYDSKFTTRINQQIHYNYALASNRGLDTLKAAVAISAFHNSEERFDPPKCHSGTRDAVLARIMQWVRREIDPEKPIMWVYGAAGTGKSAIEQTIAELFDAEDGDIFVCSFFFSRADGSRNHSKAFVATIAYQMVVATPSLRPLIDAAVERDSLLLSRSLEVQMTRLIIQPFQRLLAESGSEVVGRYFIIVDGLDECMDGSRIQLIEEVQRLVTVLGHGSRFIASFASRPEPDIKRTFLYTSVSDILTSVALDDDYRAHDDIRLFLSEKFATIQRTRPRIPKTWPTKDQLETLVKKASGQFIYASTVYNYVSSPHHNPIQRLDIVLGLAPANGSLPFAQLDALYRQILLSAPSDCVDEGIRVVVTIHAMCSLSGRLDAYIPVACRLMDLEEGNFMTHLDNYASIIGVVSARAWPLHASLGDFLSDPKRSLDLYTDFRTEHGYIFERLMQYLAFSLWESEISKHWDTLSEGLLLYAFQDSMHHLLLANKTPSILEHLRLIFRSSFLENIVNLEKGSLFLSHRVFLAVQLFLPIKTDLLPTLKDSNVDKEYQNAISQLIPAFIAKETPENNRLLKLFVTTEIRQTLPFENLANRLHTLFHPQAVMLCILSDQTIILDYFNNPLVPATERLLRPSDYIALAVQLLLYLHNDFSPRSMKAAQSFLSKRTYRNALPFSRKYRATLEYGAWTTYWPKYPFVETPGIDASRAKELAVTVTNSIRLALHFLAFVLPNAPPTSYRLLRLCQQLNINRFPWCISPTLAHTIANAMKRYRNQFIPNRRVHHLDKALLPAPKNDITLQDLIDKTCELDLD